MPYNPKSLQNLKKGPPKREDCVKGAIKTNEIISGRKTMKEILDIILAEEVEDKGSGKKYSKKEVGLRKLSIAFMNGDPKAIKAIWEMTGEAMQKIDLTNSDGSLHHPSLIIETVKPAEK